MEAPRPESNRKKGEPNVVVFVGCCRDEPTLQLDTFGVKKKMLREITGSAEATLNAAARSAVGYYARLEMHEEICDILYAQKIANENFLKNLQSVVELNAKNILAAAKTETGLAENHLEFWTAIHALNAIKIYNLFDGIEEQDREQGAMGQPDSAFFTQLEAHLHINIKGVRKIIVDTLCAYVDECEALRRVPISVIPLQHKPTMSFKSAIVRCRQAFKDYFISALSHVPNNFHFVVRRNIRKGETAEELKQVAMRYVSDMAKACACRVELQTTGKPDEFVARFSAIIV